jgi:hypothetical protein
MTNHVVSNGAIWHSDYFNDDATITQFLNIFIRKTNVRGGRKEGKKERKKEGGIG